MKIFATVLFGSVKVTQSWRYVTMEVAEGEDEMCDFIELMQIEGPKVVAIKIERQLVAKSGENNFYLGVLNSADAVMIQ